MILTCLRRTFRTEHRKLHPCQALRHDRNAFESLRRGTLLSRSRAPPPQSCPLSLLSIPTVLLPPIVFGGLVITLWTYKCIMMVAFQNKIIYMPSVPPFSRSEKVEDYAVQCTPVVWKEHDIKSVDGTALKLLEGKTPSNHFSTHGRKKKRHVAILYLQGNASSLPPRLPYLSSVLKSLAHDRHTLTNPVETQYTIFALSYRGFWTSRGRPTQAGIELDALAALDWLSQNTLQNGQDSTTQLVLWGQSIGAGVATTTLANLLAHHHRNPAKSNAEPPLPHVEINTLILETPFLSLRSMLITLYPQKWLPYRYLWPFLRSTWDSEAAIRNIATSTPASLRGESPTGLGLKKILLLQAGHDEIVPAAQTEALEKVCREELGKMGVEVERVIVEGALHTEVLTKPRGRGKVVECLRGVWCGVT